MPEKSTNAVLLFAISPSKALKVPFYGPQFGNKLTNNKNAMTLENTQWPTEKMAKSCLSFHSLHLEAIKHLALCFCLWCQIPEGKLCENRQQSQLHFVQVFREPLHKTCTLREVQCRRTFLIISDLCKLHQPPWVSAPHL